MFGLLNLCICIQKYILFLLNLILGLIYNFMITDIYNIHGTCCILNCANYLLLWSGFFCFFLRMETGNIIVWLWPLQNLLGGIPCVRALEDKGAQEISMSFKNHFFRAQDQCIPNSKNQAKVTEDLHRWARSSWKNLNGRRNFMECEIGI